MQKQYDFYITTHCSATEQSEAAKFTVTTPCFEYTLPYKENFDDYVQESNNDSWYNNRYVSNPLYMPSCWTFTNSTTNTYNNNGYSYAFLTSSYYISTPRALGLHPYHYTIPVFAVFPRLETSAENVSLKFNYRAYNPDGYQYPSWGVMTDPSNPSTYIKLGDLNPNDWNNHTINIPDVGAVIAEHNPVLAASILAGTAPYLYLAFQDSINQVYTYNGDRSWFVDDIEVDWSISHCPAAVADAPVVTHIEYDNVDVDRNMLCSATLSWTLREGVPADAVDYYEVGVCLKGADTTNMRIVRFTDNSNQVVNNLRLDTSYYFYVRAKYKESNAYTGNDCITPWSERILQRIEVTEAVGGCPRPVNVGFDTIGRRIVVVSWQKAAEAVGEQTYEVMLSDDVIMPAELESVTDVTAMQRGAVTADTHYTFNVIDRNRQYHFYLRSVCDDEHSGWTHVAVTTSDLYDCDFLDYGTFADELRNAYWIPFRSDHLKSYSQQLYQAAGMNTTDGYMKSLSFHYHFGSDVTRHIQLYIGNTEKSDLASSWISVNSMQKVFDGDYTFHNDGSAWTTVPFDVPFHYTGKNVVVAMMDAYEPSSYNSRFYYSYNTDGNYRLNTLNKVRYYYTNNGIVPLSFDANGMPYDGNNVGNPSLLTQGEVIHDRVNIRFNFCHTIDACPEVDELAATLTGEGSRTADITWKDADTVDYFGGYDVQVVRCDVADGNWTPAEQFSRDTVMAADGNGGNIGNSGVAGTASFVAATRTKALSDLRPNTAYRVYVRTLCPGDPMAERSAWDSVDFRTNPSCKPVSDILVTPTGKSTANLAWTRGSTEQSDNFVVQIYDAPQDTDNIVYNDPAAVYHSHGIATNQHGATGLECGKTYYAYVTNVCGEGDTAPWRGYVVRNAVESNAGAKFVMPECCTQPVGLSVVEIGADEAILAWNRGVYGDESAWRITYVYGEVGDSQDNVLTKVVRNLSPMIDTVRGLKPTQSYRFYVQALDEERGCLSRMSQGATAGTSDTTAYFTSFSINDPNQQVGTAVIDQVNRIVTLQVNNGTDRSNMRAVFEYGGRNVTSTVSNVQQTSNSSRNNYNDTVKYRLYAEDQDYFYDWKVVVRYNECQQPNDFYTDVFGSRTLDVHWLQPDTAYALNSSSQRISARRNGELLSNNGDPYNFELVIYTTTLSNADLNKIANGTATGLQQSAIYISDIHDTRYHITGLTPNTQYYIYVRRTCSPNAAQTSQFESWYRYGAWNRSDPKTSAQSQCDSIATIAIQPVGDGTRTFDIDWTTFRPAEFGVSGYSIVLTRESNVRYPYEKTPSRAMNAGTYTIANQTTNALSLDTLQPDTKYHLYLRPQCSEDGYDFYGNWRDTTFTTYASCRIAEEVTFEPATLSSGRLTWRNSRMEQGNDWNYVVSTTQQDVADDATLSAMATAVMDDTTTMLTGLTCGTDYYLYIQHQCVGEQSRWLEVPLQPISCCPAPEALRVDSTNNTNVVISWLPSSILSAPEAAALQYKVEVRYDGTQAKAQDYYSTMSEVDSVHVVRNIVIDQSQISTTADGRLSYRVGNLAPCLDYTLRLFSVCGEGDTSIAATTERSNHRYVAFTTSLPYFADFENEFERAAWQLPRYTDDGSNRWYISRYADAGIPTNSDLRDTGYVLHVSNDAAAYAANARSATNNDYTNTGQHTFAYRRLNLTKGYYTYNYDWRVNGYSNNAWCRVGNGTDPSRWTDHYCYVWGASVYYTTAASVSNTEISSNGNNTSPQWQHLVNDRQVQFTNDNDGRWLIMNWWGGGAYNPAFSIDNITIERVCPPVKANTLTVDSVSDNLAVLTWVSEYGDTAWHIKYGPVGMSESDAGYGSFDYHENSENPHFTIGGLQSGKSYSVFVWTDCNCSGSGYSTASVSIDFKTNCSPAVLPYREDFDSYGNEDGYYSGDWYNRPSQYNNNMHYLPSCWAFPYRSMTMGNYSWNFLNNHPDYVSSGMALSIYTESRSYPNYAVLPEFDKPVDSLQISFHLKDYSVDAGWVSVGYMTLANNNTTGEFTPIYNCEVGTYKRNVLVDFRNRTSGQGSNWELANCAQPIPAGARLAFRVIYSPTTSTAGCSSIDEVLVEVAPTCPHIYNLKVSEYTNNSARLTWDGVDGVQGFVVAYRPVGGSRYDTVRVLQAARNFAKITGLRAGVEYEFAVSCTCGADSYGPATVVNQTTVCGPQMLPYAENFDQYGTGDINTDNTDYFRKFNNDGQGASSVFAPTRYSYGDHYMPTCWQFAGMASNHDNSPQLYLAGGIWNGSRAVSRTADGTGKSLIFHTTTGSVPYVYAAMPQFRSCMEVQQTPIDSLRIRFSHRDFQDNSTFRIGYMTNPNDASTFVEYKSFENKVDWKDEDWVDFSALSYQMSEQGRSIPYGSVIAFRWDRPNWSYYYCGMLDSIIVEKVPPCPDVLNITFSNTYEQQRVDWDESEGATAYEIQYGRRGFQIGTGTTISNINHNYVVLTDLLSNTEYDFYVRSYCATSNSWGVWSQRATHRTSCADQNGVIADQEVPFFEDFDWYSKENDNVINIDNTHYYHMAVGDMIANVPQCWTFPMRQRVWWNSGCSYYPIMYLDRWADENNANRCWTLPQQSRVYTYGATSGTTNPQYINPTTNHYNKSNDLRLVGSHCGGYQVAIAVLPKFSKHVNQLELKFDYRYQDNNSGTRRVNGIDWPGFNYGYAEVGYMPASVVEASVRGIDSRADTTKFVPIKILPFSHTHESDSVVFCYDTLPDSVDYYMAIRYYNFTSDYGNSSLAIENVQVDTLPQCLRPGDVEADMRHAVGDGAVHLSWKSPVTYAGADAPYKYKVMVFTSDRTNAYSPNSQHGAAAVAADVAADQRQLVQTLYTNDTHINIEGLECVKYYDIYVKTCCSAADAADGDIAKMLENSTWLPIQAPCTTYTLPYTMDFEEIPTEPNYYSINEGCPSQQGTKRQLDEFMPACWAFAGQMPGESEFRAFLVTDPRYCRGNKGLKLQSYNNPITATLPKFDRGIDSCMIRFDYSQEYCDRPIELGYMTDPNDRSTFVLVETMPCIGNEVWNMGYEHDFSQDTHHFPADAYIAFRNNIPSGGWRWTAIDNITVTPVTPCAVVHNLSSVTVSGDAVRLKWTAPIGAEYYLVLSGDKMNDFHPDTIFDRFVAGDYTVTLRDRDYVEFDILGNHYRIDTFYSTTGVVEHLKPNTDYMFYVRSQCLANELGTWTYATASTSCERVALPYFEDFEAYNTPGYYTTNPRVVPARYNTQDHHLPYCWSFPSLSRWQDWYPQYFIVDSGRNEGLEWTYNKSSKALVLRHNGSNIIWLPNFETTIDSLYLEFYVRNYYEWSGSSPIEVGYVDVNNTFYTLPLPLHTESSYDYRLWYHDFSSDRNSQTNSAIVYPNKARLAFRLEVGYNYPLFIDNVAVEKVGDLKRPVNFRISRMDETTATLTWVTDRLADSCRVVYGPAGFERGMGDTVRIANAMVRGAVAAEQTVTITGLNPNTEYDFYLRNYRGELSQGYEQTKHHAISPASKATIRTASAPKPLPWDENFDSYISTQYSSSESWNHPNIMPGSGPNPGTCRNLDPIPDWFFVDRSGYYEDRTYRQSWITKYNTDCYRGRAALALKTCNYYTFTTALPYFDEDAANLSISFEYSYRTNAGANGWAELGVMTSPYDTSSFKMVKRILPPLDAQRTGWNTFELTTLADYGIKPEDGKYIAIRLHHLNQDDNGVLDIDNIHVERINPCRPPQRLAVKNITADEATMIWQGYDTTYHNFEVQYSTDKTFRSGVVSRTVTGATEASVTGLAAQTSYYFRVRALCGDAHDQEGEWSQTGVFATVCSRVETVPYVNYFDSYYGHFSIGGEWQPSIRFNADNMPDCWSFPQVALTSERNTSTYPQIFLTTHSDCRYSANVGMGLRSHTEGEYKPAVAVLPPMDQPVYNLKLKFNYRHWNASWGSLQVGVVTNPGDTASFIPLTPIYPRNTRWTEIMHDFSLDNLDSTTSYYIAFRMMPYFASGVSANNTVFIDNIEVTPHRERPIVAASYRQDTNTSIYNAEVDYYTPGASPRCYQIAYASVNVPEADNTAHNVNGYRVLDQAPNLGEVEMYDTFFTCAPQLRRSTIYQDGTNTTVFQNVTPGTGYYYAVRAIYGDHDTSDWSLWIYQYIPRPADDRTCVLLEDFEGDVSQWRFIHDGGTDGRTHPNRWYIGEPGSSPLHDIDGVVSTKGLYVSNDGGATNQYQGTPAFTDWTYAVRPITIPPHTGNVKFSYDFRGVGQNGKSYMVFFICRPDQTIEAGKWFAYDNDRWLMADNYYGQANYGQWSPWDDAIPAGEYIMGFGWRNENAGSQPPASVDNIQMCYKPAENITCLPPKSLTIDSVADTVVRLVWYDSIDRADWTLEYGHEGFVQGYGTTIDLHETAGPDSLSRYAESRLAPHYYTIGGLTSSSRYTVYLYTHCGQVGGISSFSTPAKISFSTGCGSVNLPYYESFDNYTYEVSGDHVAPGSFPNHPVPNCWTISGQSKWVNARPYSQAFISKHGYAAYQGGQGLLFKTGDDWTPNTDVTAVLPAFAAPLDTLKLSFYYRSQDLNDYTTLNVGYTTNPEDPNAFVSLDILPKQTAFTYYEYDYSLAGIEFPEGARIAIQYPHNKVWSSYTREDYSGIDNLSVDYTAPCYNVVNLHVAEQPVNALTVAWDTLATVRQYHLRCYPDADYPEFVVSTTDTLYATTTDCHYTFTDMSVAQLYKVEVWADCGNSQSNRAVIVSRAGCATRTLPYSEDFESYKYRDGYMMSFTNTGVMDDRWFDPPAYFPERHTLPACWLFPNNVNVTNRGSYPQSMLYHGMFSAGNYAEGEAARLAGQGKNCLMMRNDDNDAHACYALLPYFELPLDSLILELDYCHSSHWDTCPLQIGYIIPEGTLSSNIASLEGFARHTWGTNIEASGANTFVELDRLLPNCTTYVHYRFDYSQKGLNLPDGARIALRYRGDNTNRYMFVDNVKVYARESCRKPEGMRFERVNDDSIRVSWTMLPEASRYRLAYNRHDKANDGEQVVYTTTNIVVIPAKANTLYDFRLQPYCASCDAFGATDSVQYRTPCGSRQPLPYYEDYDYYTKNVANEYYRPWNYDKGVNNGDVNSIEYPYNHATAQCVSYPWRNSNFINYGDWQSPKDWVTNHADCVKGGIPGSTLGGNAQALRSNRGQECVMIFPQPDTNVRYTQLKIDYKFWNAGAVTNADLGYVSSFTNGAPTDFVSVKPLTPNTTWLTDSCTFMDLPNDGNNYYAAIRYYYTSNWDENSQMYVDNIEITVPDCLPVGNFELHDEMAMENATFYIDWNGPSNARTYLIEYGPKGFNQGSGIFDTLATNRADFSALDFVCNKEYDIYVTTQCDACDSRIRSFWTFRAPCHQYELPHAEDFDSYTTNTNNPSHYASTTPIDTNYMPPCWVFPNSQNYGGNYDYWPYSYTFLSSHHNTEQNYSVGNDGYYYYDPYRSLALHSGSSGGLSYAVMPMMVRTAQDLGISFRYKMANTTYTEFTWGVVSDPHDMTTYI
ncbi:MAG: fibronectin type III domain-containing protein, partial [Bacteroidales bacterium]|nr:fibronectin type III domain-containing protein [Candidatus Colimorpha onthohippi]